MSTLHRFAARLAVAMALLCAPAACEHGQPDPTLAGSVAGKATWKLVSFPTSDGGVIYADEYGRGERGLVLAHGGRFNKESWRRQALVFAQEGFRALAIDFRGRGQSRGGATALEDPDDGYPLDVLAAVRYLRETGVREVSVIGASFGGWAAAEATIAAEPGEIDRLVLLAHSPIDEPERLRVPTLFIAARDDPYADGSRRLTDIREQYERAGGPKRLVALDGAAHAQRVFATDQADRLLGEMLRFLRSP